jgi:soluble lytic murein transglycosylase-like protein
MIALCLALVVACAPVKLTPPAAPAPEPAASVPAPPPLPAPKPEPIALSWDDSPERAVWSRALVDAIRARKSDLDAGNPDTFIPGYAALSADGQVKFWAELVIAIAKYESTWNPHAHFKEPPPLKVTSIGLLQIAYEDQKEYHFDPPLDRETHSLENPATNLRCGVAILAQLVSHDGAVVGGKGDHSRGAARFWAVLRGGKSHRLAAIKALTKKNAAIP